MAPTFSVVMPTYNQAEYLKLSLQSVLDQTFRDFDVVVVNNHSTDNTLDVIDQIKDERVRVIDYQNNGVIGAARNVGIKATQGSYVAFLDSDDTWKNNKLEKVAEAIEADPQVGLLCHDQLTKRDGRIGKPNRYGPPAGFDGSTHDYLLLVGNCLSTSSTVVARKYLDEVGGFSEDPALITVEDYDLWLRLSQVCRFQFIHDFFGTQVYHLTSSSANVEPHLQSTLAILDKYFGALTAAQKPYPARAARRRYAEAFYRAGRGYHRRGIFARTLGYYAKTLRTYPLFLRTYGGLGLLLVDRILGQSRRKKIIDRIRPDSWPATWMIS